MTLVHPGKWWEDEDKDEEDDDIELICNSLSPDRLLRNSCKCDHPIGHDVKHACFLHARSWSTSSYWW